MYPIQALLLGYLFPLGSMDSDTETQQFQGLVNGTADEDHGCLEQEEHLLGSGGAKVTGGEAEVKFVLAVREQRLRAVSCAG